MTDETPVVERASLPKVLRDQRRAVVVGVVMAVGAVWIFAPLGEWKVGVFVAVGTLIGVVNHLATEYSLLRMIAEGQELTRSRITSSAIVRLLTVSVLAVALVVAFWPAGLTALIGLALYRLVALVMTSIPMLKELSKA